MRALVLMLVGLVVGAMIAVIAGDALRARNAFPHAVMTLTGHHMGALREAATASPCQPEQAAAHLQTLSALAADIEPAFLSGEQPDTVFVQYAQQYRQTLTEVGQHLSQQGCDALKSGLGDIGDRCKACHRDYK